MINGIEYTAKLDVTTGATIVTACNYTTLQTYRGACTCGQTWLTTIKLFECVRDGIGSDKPNITRTIAATPEYIDFTVHIDAGIVQATINARLTPLLHGDQAEATAILARLVEKYEQRLIALESDFKYLCSRRIPVTVNVSVDGNITCTERNIPTIFYSGAYTRPEVDQHFRTSSISTITLADAGWPLTSLTDHNECTTLTVAVWSRTTLEPLQK